jgi:hypothetical protein
MRSSAKAAAAGIAAGLHGLAESPVAYQHPRSAVAEPVPSPTCGTICLPLQGALKCPDGAPLHDDPNWP